VTLDQTLLTGVLVITLGLFVWGRYRFDIVAAGALITTVVLGLVPADAAFAGFGHPAVITVAAVLIISRTLGATGALDRLAAMVGAAAKTVTTHIMSLSGLAALLSAFMNNVGALALLMPVAVQTALREKRSPATILMPLSFGSILGGLVTLIGTPPNIIIATYRGTTTGEPFRMFDFAPVGGGIAVVGLIFLVTVGWRLIPTGRRAANAPGDLMEIDEYVTEVAAREGNGLLGQTLQSIGDQWEDDEVVIVALIRGDRRLTGPIQRRVLKEGDILLLKGEPEPMTRAVGSAGLEFVGDERPQSEDLHSEEVTLMEVVVASGASIEGRAPRDIHLRDRYGVNLLALSRQGATYKGRIANVRFRVGDVLLLQGDAERMPEVIAIMGCLPLVQRDLKLRSPKRVLMAAGIFGGAIALTASGFLPAAVALSGAVLLFVLSGVLSPRELYDGVDWPVIVLLGAMIPVGGALEATGMTQLIAEGILTGAAGIPVYLVLGFILVVTMTLSDIMNNAATAVVMAPIGVAVANGLDASSDAFLMAVAIGASSAFLTPIGHQNNALVMGPGGYRFGDYWRVGLPLEVIIVVVAVPLLAWFWPL
jgi:di/tricarboxylate transporter